MEPIRLDCFLDSNTGKGFWTRQVTFPCFPFPGLNVGCHTVKIVSVCQCNLDGEGGIMIEFEPVDDERFLEKQGWKWNKEG